MESVANQTLNEIEVIVVDDGSTDKSADICDDFLKNSRFRIYHNENRGVSEARNFGINKATGVYCMFVDSDDWLEVCICEELYEAATKNDVDMVICGNYNEATKTTTARFLYCGNQLFKKDSYIKNIAVRTLGLTGEYIADPSKLDKLTPIWARLYKMSIIKDHNIRFIDLNKLPSECLQFNFEFSVCATSAFYLNKVLYHYRRNTQMSVTKPYRKDLQNKWLWWIDYEKAYIQNNSLPKEFEQALYSRICCSIIPLGGNALKRGCVKEQLQECNSILSLPIYKRAFSKVDYRRCPIYWRVFFWSASKRHILLFYMLTVIMRKMLQTRKK